VRLTAEIARQPAFAGIVRERIFPTDEQLANDPALDGWLRESVTTQHHSAGTCRMGPATDPGAVVDHEGRVHGLAGLRVVDASIMPDVVCANTHATVLMIAEKLADAIRGRT
jgi:choline dehydrogenase